MAEERPLPPRMVRPGSRYVEGPVTVEIVEVIRTKDFIGRPLFIISYRLREGSYVSPVAHWFVYPHEDLRKLIRETVDFYLSVKKSILRRR